MKEPSASQLSLAAKCGHPWTSGIRWPDEDPSAWGAFGNRVHEAIEAKITGDHAYPWVMRGLDAGETTALERCVEAAREHLASHAHNGGEVRVEAVLRYDVEAGTARLAESRFERKEPGVWTMIADAVVLERDRVIVIDWKTGRQTNTEPAKQNPQVRLGAVAAARLFKVRRALVELVYLDEDGARVDGAAFGPLELATIATELRALRRTLTSGPTPPVPGMHCTQGYCRLRGICAATQSALATVQPVGERFSVELRDEAHARWTVERLPGARAALEAVERAVKDFAKRRPIPLSDGRVYGWREATKRIVNVDTPEREAALRDALGVFADVAIQRETNVTLESIEEAARQAANAAEESRGKARRLRVALDALERTGGLEVQKYEKCETFKLKETTS